MFFNIGGKIMTAAKVLGQIGIIGSIFIGFILLLSGEEVFLAGLFLVLFPLAAWLFSLILYGFGHLIDNSDRLVSMAEKSLDSHSKTSSDHEL